MGFLQVQGMTLEDAGKIRNTEIAQELCLPPVKRECYFLSAGVWARFETETTLITRDVRGRLTCCTSALFHVGRRRDQIRNLELLLQESASEADELSGNGASHAEG